MNTPTSDRTLQRHLMIVRHANAVPGNAAVADVDRPLLDKGRVRAAARAGHVQRFDPNQVYCSPALRTRETVQAFAVSPDVVQFEPVIYQATAWDLLDLVRRTSAENDRIMLVGHQPAVQHLVQLVTCDSRELPFAPAAMVVVGFDGPWATIEAAGDVVAFWP